MEEEIIYLGSLEIPTCTIESLTHKHNGRSKLTVVIFKELDDKFLFNGDLTLSFEKGHQVSIIYADSAIIGSSSHKRQIIHNWIREIKLLYPQISTNYSRKRINWLIL